MLGTALGLSLIGAVAWAQNLEVKGNAWFATGGSGSAGIGTATPLGKLHVISSGVSGGENADGTSQVGGVPFIAQADGSVLGVLNGNGRQAFALNVEGNGGTAAARGYPVFYDKYDGSWHPSLVLYRGYVGVRTPTVPAWPLDVNGDVHVSNGWLRTEGNWGWLSSFGGGWYMSDATWIRAYGGRSLWVDGTTYVGGSTFVGGSVGVGTSTPAVKLAVGGSGSNVYATDAWIDNNIHVQGNETLVQGGRGRLRVGSAWGYSGLYAEVSSTGVANDLVLGASSSRVLVHDNLAVNAGLTVAQNLTVSGRIRATTGTLVYQMNGSCPGAGGITTATACTYCSRTNPDNGSCMAWSTVSNAVIGRLVDP
jgi:hypothetical protein